MPFLKRNHYFLGVWGTFGEKMSSQSVRLRNRMVRENRVGPVLGIQEAETNLLVPTWVMQSSRH